jgi:hypothetical protein
LFVGGERGGVGGAVRISTRTGTVEQ